jgi:hypothetical protein
MCSQTFYPYSFLNSSSIYRALTVLTVIFSIGACLSITGRMCSVLMLFITHIRPTNRFYIFNIGISVVWSLIYNFRPSLWNLVFSGCRHYIMVTTSNGCGYSFRTKFCSVLKMSSTHVNYIVPVTFVNTMVGWLITWSRLQALVIVSSFLLSGQHDEN